MSLLNELKRRNVLRIVLLAALLASSPVLAHIVLLDPPARTPDTGLTIGPCGEKPKDDSVATYAAGSNIEITFAVTQQHVQVTHLYISYDDFATRTKLAQTRTPESNFYTMNVPLPAQPLGPAVLQLNHQDYYSCADITLEEGPPFKMNAGLNDAWFNPFTDGQGFFITVFPDIGFVSLAWFTYDTELPAEGDSANLGDPGHRWLTALGAIEGNQAVMDISVASGGIFDASSDIERTEDGSITLTFANCNSGTIEYDIPSIGQQGMIPIQRVVDDNVALCETLSAD